MSPGARPDRGAPGPLSDTTLRLGADGVRLAARIGEGTLSEVYRGTQRSLERALPAEVTWRSAARTAEGTADVQPTAVGRSRATRIVV